MARRGGGCSKNKVFFRAHVDPSGAYKPLEKKRKRNTHKNIQQQMRLATRGKQIEKNFNHFFSTPFFSRSEFSFFTNIEIRFFFAKRQMTILLPVYSFPGASFRCFLSKLSRISRCRSPPGFYRRLPLSSFYQFLPVHELHLPLSLVFNEKKVYNALELFLSHPFLLSFSLSFLSSPYHHRRGERQAMVAIATICVVALWAPSCRR